MQRRLLSPLDAQSWFEAINLSRLSLLCLLGHTVNWTIIFKRDSTFYSKQFHNFKILN